MIQALQNIWNVPDLKKRILFMLGMLAVYRIGAYIPIPCIDPEALEQWFSQNPGTVLGFLDLFSGGSFRRLTVFALGIMPYITASIILQLLTVVWPYLEKLSKEGELGRRKITTYTRYLTVVLAAIQSATMAMAFQRTAGVRDSSRHRFHPDDDDYADGGHGVHHVAGRADHRARNRQRNVADHLCRYRRAVAQRDHRNLREGQHRATGRPLVVIVIVAVVVAIVAFVVLVERGQRRITVQYAKRVVGRRVLGGQSTHLPLRVNTSGVIPVIFASSVLTFPQTFGMIWQDSDSGRRSRMHLRSGEPVFTSAVRRRDHLLLLLLHVDHLQSE